MSRLDPIFGQIFADFGIRSTRCVEGRRFRHDPQHDDPDLETDIGECPECDGKGCEHPDSTINTFA